MSAFPPPGCLTSWLAPLQASSSRNHEHTTKARTTRTTATMSPTGRWNAVHASQHDEHHTSLCTPRKPAPSSFTKSSLFKLQGNSRCRL
uniref:Putative secreted protein n=1 Tax=Anopheles marajoara TaxID=58244 RepID=A0A2M4CA14_9DIPT